MPDLTATIYQNGKRFILTIPEEVIVTKCNIVTVSVLVKNKSTPR